MNDLVVETVPYFEDNFSYLIHEKQEGITALVDCGEIYPVLLRLEECGWKLDYILATHFHFDHAGEIDAMKRHFPNVTVIKPEGENRL
ncbi:MAG: MBL fold metallo-hydrolase, partial [SAR324 cluster bacterium]|nr:MBL fold metallo-hydrolase [SAR324 cluster bacterium]